MLDPGRLPEVRVTFHVGLNLVYLVPGETGGMETYARELIPALREVAPRPAPHRVREQRGVRGETAPGARSHA